MIEWGLLLGRVFRVHIEPGTGRLRPPRLAPISMLIGQNPLFSTWLGAMLP